MGGTGRDEATVPSHSVEGRSEASVEEADEADETNADRSFLDASGESGRQNGLDIIDETHGQTDKQSRPRGRFYLGICSTWNQKQCDSLIFFFLKNKAKK